MATVASAGIHPHDAYSRHDDSENRDFMIKVIHIIATNSYLAKTMKSTMPEDIKRLLEKIHIPA